MSQEPIEYPLVDNSAALNVLIENIADASLLALDTEFIRERTYYPELCLLQIATGEVIAAIDCLAPINLDPLFETILAKEKSWLFHSARQDLEVVFNRTGKLPARLIDTQIAASLVGLPVQVGLQALLENTLEVEIGKQHTRADWKRRPLPEAFLNYALDDVRYLIPALRQLNDQLETLGRASWFDEECARHLALPIEPDVATIFERAKGTGKLRGKHRAAALALIAWREERARAANKPRRWILADDQLVKLAATLPETLADLKSVQDLPPRLVSRSGSHLLDAIRDAEPVDEIQKYAAPDKTVVRSLQSEIKARAEALGIQPELLATRRDISEVAAGQLPEGLSTGWRGSILADLLEQFSRGQAS